jgi:predicted metalloprotease with PDZ domain
MQRHLMHYTVAMSQPTSHLFEVTLTVASWQQGKLDLKMPVWTPGSYLVREYARHLQGFSATANGQPIRWQKQAKNHWQLQTPQAIEQPIDITVQYKIFANELTVRTNHLDRSHGYFNGAALFCFIPGRQAEPIMVTILPPPDWQVATPLPLAATNLAAKNTYEALNFDILVDSPFEIGQHTSHPFEVMGKPHQYVIWGEHHNVDVPQLLQDTAAIIKVEAELFGGLPYERYMFLLHLPPQGFGGLEHRDSCSLIYSRRGWHDRVKYEDFLQLVAHEFFHLWNIKRLRPAALTVFDYEAENYTPSLWFSEGTTSYYDLLIPFRAKIYNAKTYLKNLSKEITRYLTTPGRWVQPLSESSFDAWIKLYRPDANTPNSQMSYYLKGEMVTLLLDLAIRIKHQNQKSFDDVLRSLWESHGQSETGFTPDQLQDTITAIAGFDLTDFFARYIDGLDALPFDEYLAGFGLRLASNNDENSQPPFFGVTLTASQGKAIVKFVVAGSPAEQAGIDVGDELLAIDDLRIKAEQWSERLKEYQAGDRITVTFFHQDVLSQTQVTLRSAQASQYFIVPIATPTAVQVQNLSGWLGVSLAELAAG